MSARTLSLVLLALSLPALGQDVTTQQEQTSPASSSPAQQSTTEGNKGASAATIPAPDLTPDANGKLSQEQMQQLFRVVAEKYIENDKRRRDYTYIGRDVERKLDGKGETKSTEVRTYEILEIYGERVQRLIEKDDKPLDAKEAAKEEEKLQKIIDKRKDESEDERRRREEKEEKEHEESRNFVREVADAYNFTLVGTELVGGREAWVIDGEPRPGYEPHSSDTKFLPKFHGRVWIDKTDLQLARAQVEAIDTVSVGWVLARIHKGAHFMMERTRVNDEVWLPLHVTFRLDMRIALVKGEDLDGELTFRDYKKFRTSAKIVGVGEVKDEK
jgi:hypothetical protein